MLIAETLGTDNIDYYFLETGNSADYLTDEDIVNYLIASGTTVEQINYVNDEEIR